MDFRCDAAARLAVGRARVDLRVWRDHDDTRWDADVREGVLRVRQESWGPWIVEDGSGLGR